MASPSYIEEVVDKLLQLGQNVGLILPTRFINVEPLAEETLQILETFAEKGPEQTSYQVAKLWFPSARYLPQNPVPGHPSKQELVYRVGKILGYVGEEKKSPRKKSPVHQRTPPKTSKKSPPRKKSPVRQRTPPKPSRRSPPRKKSPVKQRTPPKTGRLLVPEGSPPRPGKASTMEQYFPSRSSNKREKSPRRSKESKSESTEEGEIYPDFND